MFTGLIEQTACVTSVQTIPHLGRLQISAPQMAAKMHIGESVAVNGCCLTIAGAEHDQLSFDLLDETISRTNLGGLKPSDVVNLERALPTDGRIGGHFVQGHVDCTARILSFDRFGANRRLELELPKENAQYVAEKGSIAVDGISLTIAQVNTGSFVCWIVPHTERSTNLAEARRDDFVNLEFDILAKYVERILPRALANATGGK